jgi:23S rRNA pseudouridine1911/1915/1917 synthase
VNAAFTVPEDSAGKRLDTVIGAELKLPRARLKELFDAGAVRVDGRKAKKGDDAKAGARVEVLLPDTAEALVPAPELPLLVLHEDESLLFLDKASGVPAHPLKPGETGTLANALVARYPEVAQASLEEREGGLCHRLDIETSGVILAARTRAAWTAMREAFTGRDVDKRYLALVSGPIADEGEIDLPLLHTGERVRPAVDAPEKAREALSRFTVLARSGTSSLVEVQILTGVLHQVRAHLAAIGAPIVGDALYGGPTDPGLPHRFFLHARALSVTHPVTGQRLLVKSPLPPELSSVLQARGLTLPGPG